MRRRLQAALLHIGKQLAGFGFRQFLLIGGDALVPPGLVDAIQALGREAGLGEACTNPFRSITARSIELVYACEEALRIIAAYDPPASGSVPVEPRAGRGFGCTEAPRGICWHRYDFEPDGVIQTARIVPPTSQNQPSIEADLKGVAETLINEPDDVIRGRCEQTIRNYDPCISCSTHFLKLKVHRA